MWRIIARGLRRGVVTAPPAALEASAPPGSKGRPALDPDRCTGGGSCVQACPTGAILLGPESGEGSTATRLFQIDYGACVFCGRCAEACAPGALRLTEDFALSALRREDLVSRNQVPVPGQPGDCDRGGSRR
jgi:hydrogenase-4 component H